MNGPKMDQSAPSVRSDFTKFQSLLSLLTQARQAQPQSADAMVKLEEGKELSEEEGRLLNQAISSYTVKDESQPEGDLEKLALKKMKLKLLTGI